MFLWFIVVNNVEKYCFTVICEHCWQQNFVQTLFFLLSLQQVAYFLLCTQFCGSVENRIEQCFIAYIVQCCQQYFSALLHPIIAQQYCSIFICRSIKNRSPATKCLCSWTVHSKRMNNSLQCFLLLCSVSRY